MRPVFFAAATISTPSPAGVRHRLLNIDVLAGADRVDHDLLVPVVGNGGHDAVDVFVLQQFVIAPGGGQVRADNFFGQSVTAIIEVAGRHALHPRQFDRVREQARSLHADADDPEAYSITGRHGLRQSPQRIGIKKMVFSPSDAPAAAALSPMNSRREKRFLIIEPPTSQAFTRPVTLN
jgi:hypothetical protein